MKILRKDIFDYISFLQLHLSNWDHKISPLSLIHLQKIYESFVNELPRNDAHIISDEDLDRLHHSIISILSHNKDDQVDLNAKIKRWKSAYYKDNPIPFIILNRNKSTLNNGRSYPSPILTQDRKNTIYFISFMVIISFIGMFLFSIEEPIVEKLDTPYIQHWDATYGKDSTINMTIDVSSILGKSKCVLAQHEYIQYDSIKYFHRDSSWRHKNDSFNFKHEIPQGILEVENSNFGTFTFYIDSVGTGHIPFYLRSKKNAYGKVYENKIELTINIHEEQTLTVDTVNGFPKIKYQDFPFPKRTLSELSASPKLELSWWGRFKWPLSLIIGLLSWLLFYFKHTSSTNTISSSHSNSGHPYFWKIELPDIPPVKLPEELDKKVHVLRNKLPSGKNTLSIPRTIKKSIDSGGFVTFEFEEKEFKTEYLFILGYQSQSDHSAQLWNEVALSLNAKDINTSVFHYDRDIRLCYNDKFPNGLNLKELHNHYSSSILVVVEQHYNLLNPKTGKLNSWVNVFNNWSTRYFLTSKNYYEWDNRERQLEKMFHVLPAKLSSISWLEVRPSEADKLSYIPDPNEHIIDYDDEFSLSDIKISFTKVQKDWIAACCLFPNLHYDVSLAIGKIIYSHHNANFSTQDMEEVFAMSWFLQGTIPGEIRKSLIADLEKRNQALVDEVRSYITQEVIFSNPPTGSHASDRFNEGIILNELLNKTQKPSASRQEELEKELNQIYARGLEADVQLIDKVNEIKNPSSSSKIKRWITDRDNQKRLALMVGFFIIPFFILNLIFDTGQCEGKYPQINAIPINNELSADYYNPSSDKYSKSGIPEIPVKICISTLENGKDIWEENSLRRKIFLGLEYSLVNVLESKPDKGTPLYSNKFKTNIAVDVFNKALQETDELDKKSTEEIMSDPGLYAIASDFCKQIGLSQNLLDHRDDNSARYEFQDSLDVFYNWCTDIVPTIAISTLDINNSKSTIAIDYFNTIVGWVLMDFSPERPPPSTDSRLYYFEKEYQQECETHAANLSDRLEENIVPRLVSTNNKIKYKYLLYLSHDCDDCLKKHAKEDTEAPTFNTKVNDIYTRSRRGDCRARVFWEKPIVADNCNLQSLECTHKSGDLFPRGKKVVTYTATDICGNTSTSSFVVTVECVVSPFKTYNKGK